MPPAARVSGLRVNGGVGRSFVAIARQLTSLSVSVTRPLAELACELPAPEHMVDRRTIRWAAFWVAAPLFAQRTGELLKSVFLARWFSKEEMGMVAILLMLHRGIEALTQMGHEAALVHRKEELLDRAIDTAFSAAILRGMGLAALMALAAPWVAEFYREPELSAFLAVSGLLFVANGARNLHMVRLTRAVDLKHPKLVVAYGAATDVVITVGVALATGSIWAVVAGRVVGGVATMAATHKVAPERARLGFDKALLLELFRYGRHIQGVAILAFLVTQLDDAVVGRLLGLDELAIYVITYTMATLPVTNIVAVASQVAFPTWARVARSGDVERRNTMFLDTLRFTWALSITLAVALVAGGEDLVAAIFGDKWRPAAAPLTVLVGVSVSRTVSTTFGALFNAIGKPNLTLREVAAQVVLIVALLIPLTREYGLMGTSWAVSGPMLLIMLPAMYFYAQVAGLGLARVLEAMWRPAVVGVAVWIGAATAATQPWWPDVPELVRALAPTLLAAATILGVTTLTDRRFRRFVWGKGGGEGGGAAAA